MGSRWIQFIGRPATPDYVELHAHSAYSFLDGASRPEELAARALELGYPAMALTDHDGLYGSMEFAQFARANGLQPITGAELTLASPFADERQAEDEAARAREERSRSSRGSGRSTGGSGDQARSGGRPAYGPGSKARGGGREDGAPPLEASARPDEEGARYHVTVLAENPQGYANLCRLITQSHMENPRGDPRLDLDALLERPEGLILLTGCRRSPLAAALERGTDEAEALIGRLRDVFGPENLFVELQNNAVHGDLARGKVLGGLADRLGLPVVATGNVHYHVADRHRLQDILVAIKNRRTVDDSHELRRSNACFHLASPQEMQWRFESRTDALRSTRAIAERCQAFDLTDRSRLQVSRLQGKRVRARHAGAPPRMPLGVRDPLSPRQQIPP